MIPDRGMSLGPFAVDRHGQLQPATAEHFPSFSVRWRQRLLRARLVHGRTEDGQGHLEFSSKLGRIPSTAAPPERAGQRDNALKLWRALPSLVPKGWTMHLAPDHSVVFATTSALRFPISAIALVTLVAEQLVALQPYLDVLDEAGIEGPGLGTVNT